MPNQHVIGRLICEVNVRGTAARGDAFSIERQVTRFCYDQLLPALERLFDEIAGPEEVLQVAHLQLNIKESLQSGWEDALVRQAVESVLRQVEARRGETNSGYLPANFRRQSVSASRFGHWLWFLEKGSFSAAFVPVPEADLRRAVLETLAAESVAASALRRLLAAQPQALMRLLLQHDAAFLADLMAAFSGKSAEALRHFLKNLEKLLEHTGRVLAQKTASGNRPAAADSKFSGKKSPAPAAQASAAKTESQGLQPTDFQKETKKIRDLLAGAKQALPLVFWEIVWHDFLLAERSPEPSAVAFLFFEKTWPKAEERRMALSILKKTGGAENGKFAALATFFEKIEDVEPGKISPEARASQKGELPAQALEKESFKIEKQAIGKQSVPQDQSLETKPQKPEIANAEISKNQGSETQKPQYQSLEKSKNQKTEASKPQHPENWHVGNAGVVLLHPFLRTLFSTLKLCDAAGQFSGEKSREKAVHVLHFLATGQVEGPEYEMLFAKFLCNWPLETPLARRIKLPQKEQRECEELLQAAIRHWPKLGQISPDGLREGFLRRPGKLSFRPFDGWLLQVEQSGLDVLLGFLPWGIGMVKLPWMTDLLHVEWT